MKSKFNSKVIMVPKTTSGTAFVRFTGDSYMLTHELSSATYADLDFFASEEMYDRMRLLSHLEFEYIDVAIEQVTTITIEPREQVKGILY